MGKRSTTADRTILVLGIIGLTAALLAFPMWDILTWRNPAPASVASRLAPMSLIALVYAAFALAVCGKWLPRVLGRLGCSKRRSEACGAAMLSVTIATGCLAINFASSHNWFAAVRIMPTPLVFLGVGWALVRLTRQRRLERTEGLRCPECEYPFGFEDERTAPEHCSECGAAWRGRLVPLVTRPPAIFLPTAAASVAVLVALLFVGPLLVRSVAPTGVLTWWVGNWPDDSAGWETLSRHSLSQSHVESLAERLLNWRRTPSHSLPGFVRVWLERQVADGLLPPRLEDRFLDEMAVIRLQIPTSMRVGETTRCSVVAVRNDGGLLYQPVVYGRGFTVGEEFFASSNPIGGIPLGGRVNIPRGALPPLHTVITPREPGRLPVRVEAWVGISTLGGGVPPPVVTLNTDGSAEQLQPGLVRLKRIVLEGEIEVRPR